MSDKQKGYEVLWCAGCPVVDRLRAENNRLVEALRVSADQIEHLQYISDTDKYGPLDALRDGRALLRELGKL